MPHSFIRLHLFVLCVGNFHDEGPVFVFIMKVEMTGGLDVGVKYLRILYSLTKR